MIVVDASALIEVLLNPASSTAIAGRLLSPLVTLHAPHLLDLEVAQAVRRYCMTGIVSSGRGQQVLEDLADMSIRRYPHAVLLPRIWQLRHNISAYDAAYLALAEALDAPLVTCDRRLASAPGHEAAVEVV